MITPEQLDSLKKILVQWRETVPPNYHERKSDTHYRDPVKLENCILWRNRWILVSDDFMEAFGEVERRLRDGRLGMEWVTW